MNKYYKILDILENNSFTAYFVGGSVRDLLLGLEITDVDIATNCRPQLLKELFSFYPTDDYALKFGSLIIKGELACQITSFRREAAYTDLRHPQEIEFVDEPAEDAQRRDFTINALYLDRRGLILDYFDGQEDLNKQLIRMIGQPDIRLKEDPLRIIRALRFADMLGFCLEEELQLAVESNLPLIDKIKRRKIAEELRKYHNRADYYDKYLKKTVDFLF